MKYLSNFAKTSATICLSSIDLSLLGPNFSNNANTTWSCFIPNPLHNTFTTSALVVEESMVILQVAKQISSKKNFIAQFVKGICPPFQKFVEGICPPFQTIPPSLIPFWKIYDHPSLSVPESVNAVFWVYHVLDFSVWII